MNRPFRVTIVLTHPIQYYSPWFRYIAAHCPQIALTVIYATEPTPQQQGIGFDSAFTWDIPLREGYASEVIRPADQGGSVHSRSFFGLNVPEIVPAIVGSAPDVVLIPGWHSVSFVRALIACKRRGIPSLYRGDSNMNSRPEAWWQPLWFAKTWVLLRLYSAYLSVGVSAREYLRTFQIDENRIIDCPHCVDNALFERSALPWQNDELRKAARRELGVRNEEMLVLFVGKLHPQKRVADAIIAVASCGEGVHLVVAGSGRDRAALEQLAVQHKATVTWLGFQNQTDVARLYALADCLVLPSDGRETWGLVVNEALAAGIPCVVSDRVGCARDLIVNGNTGFVVPLANPAALAVAIQALHAARTSREDSRGICQAHVAQYSFAQATNGLLEACERFASRRGL